MSYDKRYSVCHSRLDRESSTKKNCLPSEGWDPGRLVFVIVSHLRPPATLCVALRAGRQVSIPAGVIPGSIGDPVQKRNSVFFSSTFGAKVEPNSVPGSLVVGIQDSSSFRPLTPQSRPTPSLNKAAGRAAPRPLLVFTEYQHSRRQGTAGTQNHDQYLWNKNRHHEPQRCTRAARWFFC